MNVDRERLTGGCLCARVRFEVDRVADAGWCFCLVCQKTSGSAGLAWCAVPREAFRWSKGEPRVFRSVPSSAGGRWFCGDCGVSCACEAADGTWSVGIGTLDEPAAVVPRVHQSCETRPPWAETTDPWPRIAGDDLPPPEARPGPERALAPLPTGAPPRPSAPTIVAMSMGGYGFDADLPLARYVIELARKRRDRPRVAFLGAANGDAGTSIGRFYAVFGRLACEPVHVPLFAVRHAEVGAFLQAQDAIVVGGGNTVNLLAIWRAHGVDRALHAAWRAGVVLAGWSAGGLCWFEDGVTDSRGPSVGRLDGGLGWLAGSFVPHYDSEPSRPPTFEAMVGAGRLPDGYAVEDGVALRFEDTALAEVVTTRDGKRALRLERRGDAASVVTLPSRRL